jgi:hypothetical protein
MVMYVLAAMLMLPLIPIPKMTHWSVILSLVPLGRCMTRRSWRGQISAARGTISREQELSEKLRQTMSAAQAEAQYQVIPPQYPRSHCGAHIGGRRENPL